MKGPLRYRNRNNGKRGKWENPRVTTYDADKKQEGIKKNGGMGNDH